MKRLILIISLLTLSILCSDAQNRADKLKPQWLRQTPASRNPDVKFITTYTYSSAGHVSYADEMGRLTVNLPGEWHVSTKVSNVQVSERNLSTRRSDGGMQQTGTIETEANGRPVSINCLRVDEFRKGSAVWALYQVGKGADTRFQDCYVTEKYGGTAALLSLIHSVLPAATLIPSVHLNLGAHLSLFFRPQSAFALSYEHCLRAP